MPEGELDIVTFLVLDEQPASTEHGAGADAFLRQRVSCFKSWKGLVRVDVKLASAEVWRLGVS